MIVLGVDPGLVSGAVAVVGLDLAGQPDCDVADIPTLGEGAKTRINVHAFREWVSHYAPDHAFIERAGVMPKQGAASGFKYGRAVGAIEAVIQLMHIPVTFVEPNVWKRHFNLKGKDKESARALAVQRFPDLAPSLSRVKDHGRAESLLIAYFGAKALANPPGPLSALPAMRRLSLAG